MTRRGAAAQASTADELYREVQDAADEVGEFIGEQMKERPYMALGAAVAIGYGLGLPRGALALLAGLGSRVAMRWLETLLEEAPSARYARRRHR